MTRKINVFCRMLFAGATLSAAGTALSQNVEPLLQNGPDSAKKIIAVIGDGYAASDMVQWADDVQRMVIDGVFTEDETFRRNHTAFNIYRVDAVSVDSGVSQIEYDENGTPNDGSDDTIISQTTKNTALSYIYSGSWAHCWMQGSATTNTKLQNILSATVPNYDYIFIILNEPGFGGCGGSGRQTVTSGGSYTVMAHEMGHGIGGLHDEYYRSGTSWTGGAYNDRNCTTVTNRNTVVWHDLIDAATPVPTVYDSATMDSNTTVGIFEGCRTKETGIYRPVQSCRMRSNSPQFCPVCQRLINDILAPFVDSAGDYVSFVNWPGATCKSASAAQITYGSDATARNNDAAALTMSCPARRPDKNGWTNRAFGHAFVIDRNPTDDVCCHVESKNPGGAVEVGGTDCSSGEDTAMQVLRLDFPKMYDPYSWSHFHIDCTLPGVSSGGIASRLITYRVGQQRY
jgi:hypothetical protein